MEFNDVENLLIHLKLGKIEKITLLEGSSLLTRYTLPFAPDQSVLVMNISNQKIAQKIKLLLEKYPKNHTYKITYLFPNSGWKIDEVEYPNLGNNMVGGNLFIPPSSENSSLESFKELIAHLRSPEGCPWDREQTHLSLRSNLMEETYEVLSALDKGNQIDLKEELGDLLLQIVLHAQLAEENKDFNLSDVIADIHKKLVMRHPHVFADTKIESAKGVIRNWEILKSIEREENGQNEKQSIFSSVPNVMPALSLAQEYQKRAARVGFDWPSIEPVLEKIFEELEEVKQAQTKQRKEEELGDLIFAVVNLARWYEMDAESCLRKMNHRFFNRFNLFKLLY